MPKLEDYTLVSILDLPLMGREKKSLGKLEATKSAGWVFPNGGFNSVDGSEILRSPVEVGSLSD